jgi:aspartate dehydrogenase
MKNIEVAVAGLGTIGRAVVKKLVDGIPGLTLSAAAVGDRAKAERWLQEQGITCPIVSLEDMPGVADLAVECAPAALLRRICVPMLQAGKRVMVLSSGALLAMPDVIDLARQSEGQIIVPTGALLGLDAVSAAAEGTIHSIRMVTHKPPLGLQGAPYLVEQGISVADLTEPKRVFAGTAREAAKGFPANVNVAAALSLAGIGPDRTMVEIWADPTVTRNCHTIAVDADSASFSFSIENVPSENPKTGKITILSVIAALRKLQSPLRVGT